jgi:hypothetical protein
VVEEEEWGIYNISECLRLFYPCTLLHSTFCHFPIHMYLEANEKENEKALDLVCITTFMENWENFMAIRQFSSNSKVNGVTTRTRLHRTAINITLPPLPLEATLEQSLLRQLNAFAPSSVRFTTTRVHCNQIDQARSVQSCFHPELKPCRAGGIITVKRKRTRTSVKSCS